MAAEAVDVHVVSKAIESLLKWHKSTKKKRRHKSQFIYLILTLKKIPNHDLVNPHKVPIPYDAPIECKVPIPHKIAIPHSLLSASSGMCLIIDDLHQSDPVSEEYVQLKIESESIQIRKVLKISKLISDFRSFKAKRQLYNSYDWFFVEKSGLPHVTKLLGKQIFRKRKFPVQLDLNMDLTKQIESACASAMLFLGRGTCSSIKVANLSMKEDEIVDNVIAAIDGVFKIVSANRAKVRSFLVKLLDSVALAVYQVDPDVNFKFEGDKDVEAALKKVEKKKVCDAKAEKKGRIREIKYMDDKMSEDGTDVDDGGEDKAKDDSENGEKDNGGLVSNKREKKGVKAKNEGSSEKPLKDSAKRRKKDGLSVKAAEEGLIKDGELSKKKKKGSEPSKKKKKGVEHDDVDGDAIDDDGGEDVI